MVRTEAFIQKGITLCQLLFFFVYEVHILSNLLARVADNGCSFHFLTLPDLNL